MTERGWVREIKGKVITIAPEKSIACFGCMNQECKSGSGLITAENSLALNIKTGQLVEVEASGAGIIVQAVAAFLPPIVSFIAGYLLTRLLFPQAGEGAAAGAGIFLLFAASLIFFRIKQKAPASKVYALKKVLE